MVAVAVAAFIAIAFLGVPFPLIVAARRCSAVFCCRCMAPRAASNRRSRRGRSPRPSAASRHERRRSRRPRSGAAIWLAPVALLALAFGLQHVFTQEALFFSKVAIVTFGGAYAVLAYVAQQAVEAYHWLRPDEMLTGLGLAETTPGPLILVLVFVGFLAGARGETGLDPLPAGLIGGGHHALGDIRALASSSSSPARPSSSGCAATARWPAALAAVTAAVVGVIANLALWFGLHVLFATVGTIAFGPIALPAPDLASFDPAAALIAAAAAPRAAISPCRNRLGACRRRGGGHADPAYLQLMRISSSADR